MNIKNLVIGGGGGGGLAIYGALKYLFLNNYLSITNIHYIIILSLNQFYANVIIKNLKKQCILEQK